ICFYTVPPFGPSRILYKVNPTICLRNILVLMTIPLCIRRPYLLAELPQYLQLIVEVVEYDQLGGSLGCTSNFSDSGRIGVGDPSEYTKELGNLLDGLVSEYVPPFFNHPLKSLTVIVTGYDLFVTDSMSLIRHINNDRVSMSSESTFRNVAVDHRKLRIWPPDNVGPREVGFVLVKTVRDEDRNIIHPGITRSCR